MSNKIDPLRDYVGEMRAKVDELAQGVYFPPLIARRIVADLRANDPALLDGWLHLQAENMVRSSISERDRSKRAQARHQQSRSVFGADAASGSADRMRKWLEAPFSLSNGSRMELGSMRRDHLLDAGRQYQTRGETQLLTASFLQALAKEVGDGVVSEHFSEVELDTMWGSLTAL